MLERAQIRVETGEAAARGVQRVVHLAGEGFVPNRGHSW